MSILESIPSILAIHSKFATAPVAESAQAMSEST
jgi:hypothetical protein